MANGARDILDITRQNLALGSPVDAFQQGMQSGNLLRQQALQNQLLGQQVAQAPISTQALELDVQQRQSALEALGVPDEPTAQQLAINAVRIASLPTSEAKIEAIRNAKKAAVQARRSTANLDELERAYLTNEELGDQLLGGAINAFEQTGILSRPGSEVSAEQRTFENLIADFTPEEQAEARKIKAGLRPRAVGSADITTATTEGLTEQVAESQEVIEERTKFAELTGASRSKKIDQAFERVEKIDGNIRNLSRAIRAVDDGASTGAIESRFFPTLRRATKELEQVQRELGLDVIGSTTFGALSEGELQLALETALPTGLEPQALREFLVNKREAQSKLRDYYREQMNFLENGGSITEFLQTKEGVAAQSTTTQEVAPGVNVTETEEAVIPTRFVFNPATGQLEQK